MVTVEEDTGDDTFGADLYKLKWAGQERLPYIADKVLTANNHIADTKGAAETALNGEYVADIYHPWTTVRDHLQTFLGKNGNRLNEVAEVLVMAVEEFTEEDDNNSSLIKAAGSLPEIHDYTDGISGDGMPESRLPED